MGDQISLVLPADEEFTRVAHLVLGGLAARPTSPYEHLEDLQLAVDGLLERRGATDAVHLTVTVDDGVLRTAIGPFDAAALDELEHEDQPLGLRRILETVVDTFELEERDGRRWVQLTKKTVA